MSGKCLDKIWIFENLKEPEGMKKCVKVCDAPFLSEILVCADGQTAIRRVFINTEGAETETFYGTDGVIITPTTWVPGECCCNTLFKTEICFTYMGVLYEGWEYESINPNDLSTVTRIAVDEGRTVVAMAGEYVIGSCCSDCEFQQNATGAARTPCGLLRVDADPSSISQNTLEDYTITLTFPLENLEDCDQSGNFASDTLTVITIGAGSTVSNFADMVNALLGPYGFNAAYCPFEGAAVVGPAGIGNWEIFLNSNGSGDDFGLGWDDSTGVLYTREFVNGVELTNPTAGVDYNITVGDYWPARSCTGCDPVS